MVEQLPHCDLLRLSLLTGDLSCQLDKSPKKAIVKVPPLFIIFGKLLFFGVGRHVLHFLSFSKSCYFSVTSFTRRRIVGSRMSADCRRQVLHFSSFLVSCIFVGGLYEGILPNQLSIHWHISGQNFKFQIFLEFLLNDFFRFS